MTEENENVNTEGEESEGETPEKKIADDKRFTQDEVNRMIQTRLKKERDSSTGLQKGWESEKTNLSEQLDSYEKIINSFLETQKTALTEREKKFFEKLSLVDQVEFLSESLKEVNKKEFPRNPVVGSGENQVSRPVTKKFL